MKNRRNYYRLLHVQPDAPSEIIRSSYLTLMLKLKHHPDLGGEAWDAALLNRAYETLADPEKRARYDRELLRAAKAEAPKALAAPEPHPPWPDFAPKECVQRETGSGACCRFCNTPHGGHLRGQTERRCACCGSPLNPVAAFARMNAEQRRLVRRQALHREVVFYTEWPQSGFNGHIHDLSPMGVQIHTERMLEQSQVIKIDSDILWATAEVVHCRPHPDGGSHGGWVIGLKFLTLLFQRSLGIFLSVTA